MNQNTIKNCLVETCFFCKNKMILKEGTIICGSKWYHENCFHGCDIDAITALYDGNSLGKEICRK